MGQKTQNLKKLMKVQVFNYPDSNMKQEFGGLYREVRAEFFGFWTIYRTDDEKVLPRLPPKTQEHRVTAAC